MLERARWHRAVARMLSEGHTEDLKKGLDLAMRELDRDRARSRWLARARQEQPGDYRGGPVEW